MAIEWLLLSEATPEAIHQETGEEWFLTYSTDDEKIGDFLPKLSLWYGGSFHRSVTHWARLTTPNDNGGE